MPRKRISLTPNPLRWHERRKALEQRAARKSLPKQSDAFFARCREHEVLARILEREYGIEAGHARLIAMAAPTSPASEGGLRRRGRPPIGCDLYESVEAIRCAYHGKLPVGQDSPFWLAVTLQWNASRAKKQPERLFVTVEGLPAWRALRSGYQTARKKLNAKAEHIFVRHATTCPACAKLITASQKAGVGVTMTD